MPGCVWRPTDAPASISASTSSVSYPGDGPSCFDRILRVTPPEGGGAPCADASVSTNPVMAHSTEEAKTGRVSNGTLPSVRGWSRDFVYEQESLSPRDEDVKG